MGGLGRVTFGVFGGGRGGWVCGFEMSRGCDRGGGNGDEHLLVGHGGGDLRLGRPRGGHGFDDRGVRDHSFWEMYRSDGYGGTKVVQTRPRT